ncbi:MAG: DUF6325 family protein [Chloroflexota bacterium]
MSDQTDYGYELGPVEYVVFAFDGNQFNGDVVPALKEIVDAGLVRIVDLAVISKDGEDTVTILEVSELQSEVADALEKIRGEYTGLLSEEDLLMAADALPRETTAAAILFEHVWSKRFASAVRDSNGWLVTNVRIPPEVITVARNTLLEAAGNA